MTARFSRRWAALAVAVAGVLPAVPATAEAPAGVFGGSVAVDLVEVEVFVTDADGAPIGGLGRDDFEIRVDGQRIEPSHFAPPTEGAPPPRAIVWLDLASFDGSRQGELVGSLRAALPRLLAASEEVALATRRGTGWRLLQTFTRDLPTLEAALDAALELPGPRARSGLELLLVEIRNAERPRRTEGEGTFDEAFRARAESAGSRLLNQLRDEVPRLEEEQIKALSAMAPLLQAASGAPGRKALLWLGADVDAAPAEALYAAWLEKFQDTEVSRRSGLVAFEGTGTQVSEAVDRLIDRSLGGRIALYLLSPLEGRGSGGTRFETVGRFATGRGSSSRAQTAARLAAETGGLSLTGFDAGPLVDRLLAERGRPYTFAFPSPGGEEGTPHELKVTTRTPGTRLRHPPLFRDRAPRRQLVDRALGALLLDETSNPLGLTVEPGTPSGEAGERLLPLTIQFPIRRLTFVPTGDAREARLGAATVPQRLDEGGNGGEIGPIGSGEVPLRFAEAEWAVARRSNGSFTAALPLEPGRWRVGIALRDEASGTEAAVRLDVELDDQVRSWSVSSRRVEPVEPPPEPEELAISPAAEAGEAAVEAAVVEATATADPIPAEPVEPPARKAVVQAARRAFRAALAAWVGGQPFREATAAWAAERAELARQAGEEADELPGAFQALAADLVRRQPSAAWPLAAFDGELLRRHSVRREPPLAREARLAAAGLLELGVAGKPPGIPPELAARAWLILAADSTVREFCEAALDRAFALAPQLEVVAMAAASEAERADRPARALAVLDELLVLRPGHPEGRLRRAMALRRSGRAEEGRGELEALAGGDGTPDWIRSLAVQELAREALAARRADLALGRVRAERAVRRDDPLLLVQEAWIVDRLGASQQAREILDQLSAREGSAAGSARAIYSRTLLERVAPLRSELLHAADERLAALAVALDALPAEEAPPGSARTSMR